MDVQLKQCTSPIKALAQREQHTFQVELIYILGEIYDKVEKKFLCNAFRPLELSRNKFVIFHRTKFATHVYERGMLGILDLFFNMIWLIAFRFFFFALLLLIADLVRLTLRSRHFLDIFVVVNCFLL